MAYAAYDGGFAGKKSLANGYVFGAPVRDMGWIGSLIMGIALGVMGFFIATALAIFTILYLNSHGHHADFAMSYKVIGAPVGILIAAVALGYLGTFWVKRVFRKG